MENTTNITKIFCLGDGYAHGHIWPEWPQILQALRPDLEVIVISAVGAGHEFLINELLAHDIGYSTVIFQWPQQQRFDKLIQDDQWVDIVKSDPIYDFNTYKTRSGVWWCSSGSGLDVIKTYHNFYIQTEQFLQRQKIQKKLISAYVSQQNARYIDTSNAEQDKFAENLDCRGTEIQPQPLLHYRWLIESIMPLAGIEINQSLAEELYKRISSHKWVPYDLDREEIWNNMSLIELDNSGHSSPTGTAGGIHIQTCTGTRTSSIEV